MRNRFPISISEAFNPEPLRQAVDQRGEAFGRRREWATEAFLSIGDDLKAARRDPEHGEADVRRGVVGGDGRGTAEMLGQRRSKRRQIGPAPGGDLPDLQAATLVQTKGRGFFLAV